MLNAIPMVISKESLDGFLHLLKIILLLLKICIMLPFFESARSLPDGIKQNEQIWNSLYLMN